MRVLTDHFGAMAVEEASTVRFPAGLPGFEDCREFVLLQHPEQPALSFLQSLEQPALCFLAVPVRVLRPDYGLSINGEDLELLGLRAGSAVRDGIDVLTLAIVSVAEDEPPTANLLSPVVIHLQSRRAVQAIRPDGRYGCREPLAAEEAACS